MLGSTLVSPDSAKLADSCSRRQPRSAAGHRELKNDQLPQRRSAKVSWRVGILALLVSSTTSCELFLDLQAPQLELELVWAWSFSRNGFFDVSFIVNNTGRSTAQELEYLIIGRGTQ